MSVYEVHTYRWTCDACGAWETTHGAHKRLPVGWGEKKYYCGEAGCDGHCEDVCPACLGLEERHGTIFG